MATLERHVLTTDLLAEEFAGEQAYVDEPSAFDVLDRRFRSMAAALAALPAGYTVERVQGRVGLGQDPGAEYTLLNERGRTVAKVARRRIGRQRISWTPKQLGEVEDAQALSVLLLLAAADAEGRRA